MHNYQFKEFTPKSGQNGTHSFHVEAKPFQTLDNLRTPPTKSFNVIRFIEYND